MGISRRTVSIIRTITRGMAPYIINVEAAASIGDFFNGRRRSSKRNDNIVCGRGNCVVAGCRMVRRTIAGGHGAGIRIFLSDGTRGTCSTSIMNCGVSTSLTIVGVSIAKLPRVRVASSSGVGVNRCMVAMKGPNKLRFVSDIACNMVDNLGHIISDSDSVKLVRASTTVGPNGSNNTLISTANGLINVGSSGVISRRFRNVNFTVPSGAIARVYSGVVTGRGSPRPCVNVALDRGCATRILRCCKCPANTIILDIRGKDPTCRTKLHGNSVVARFGSAGVDSCGTLRGVVGSYGPRRGMDIGVCHDNECCAAAIAITSGGTVG